MAAMKFDFTAKEIIEENRVTQAEIDEIKTWLPTQDIPALTEEQIVAFIICCVNNMEETKKTIQSNYRLKKELPEVFNNRRMDKEGIAKLVQVTQGCVIYETRDDGCIIVCVGLRDPDYTKFDMAESMAVMSMGIESVVLKYPPKGLALIIDLKEWGLMHITKLKLRILKYFFQYLQEALPIRMVECHVFNTVYFIDKLMVIVKPFIGKKVLDVMHFHPRNMDMKSFHEKWIPKRCLPEDYGGDLPSLLTLHLELCEHLSTLHPYFEAEELQRLSIK